MSIRTFIDRPLLSMVISVIIVVLGAISLVSLPIEKYPDIAPPTINVWASYPGASAEAVQKSVVAPLEEAINGVENMTYMKSTADNGSGSITIFFKQGCNADMAAVNVQNRVTQAQAQLPSEVLKIGVTTEKQQPGMLRMLALVSPNGTYDENFLSNYFLNNLKPAILRIQGVGKVEVFGSPYALRIWLKPDVMARHKLVPADIQQVFQEQNVEASVGSLGANSDNVYQYTLRYTGRKNEISEYENLIISSKATGEELRLKDVADIELGQADYIYQESVNGHPGVMGQVSQTAGSNATQINKNIDKLLEEVKQTLPKDIAILSFNNTNDFLFASMHEVIETLVIAILLVLVVVYFFLQNFRATLIPAVGIIVSLIGTFAFMQAAGFSINLLTLFALVLVIGTVVDDSIVVVEAVQQRFDAGYKSAHKAAVDAMHGLTAALFTTSLVFMVIFIPVSFLGGTTGVFYRQFGLTMAVSVGISFINAITMSPALCALVLKPTKDDDGSLASRVRKAYNATYHALMKRYNGIAMFFIRRKWIVTSCIVVASVLLAVLMKVTPTGFIPQEDTGSLIVSMQAPTGYTVERTKAIMDRNIQKLRQLPGMDAVGGVAGFSLMGGSGNNQAMIMIQLKNWDERGGAECSIDNITNMVNGVLWEEHEATSFAMAPGMIDGYGNGGDFEFSVQNRNGEDIKKFYDVTQNYVAKLMERPEIGEVFNSYKIDYPQYKMDLDVSRCKKMCVSPSAVLDVMSSYLGSNYVSNINKYNKVYQVTMQLRPEDRNRMESLDKIFVRSDAGEMQPVSQFITLTKEYRPQSIGAFNLFNSIDLSGNMATGASSGNAIRAIKEVAAKELPKGYSVEFSGVTREESETGSNILIIFAISILFVYLVMVALYESLFIPMAVILAVPFGLAGSFAFALLFGVENNIYLQVGLIMLVGLLCKTAILLTEYATQCRQAGMSLKQAAFFAAKVRMRPILMTSLTMIFGMLPLLVATGAGANGSRTIGVGVVGGMFFGTLALLCITPALFVIFQKIQERFKPITFVEPTDPMIIDELKLIEKNSEEKKQKV